MKIKQIRENSTEELVSQIKENERKMLEMKVRKAAADGTKVRQLRRDVARMHTVIRERETKKND